MRVSEVLNKAADHIQQYGHIKGHGFGDGPRYDRAPACLIAAVNVASSLESGPALAALRAHIPGGYIMLWNDAPERTAAEVIEVLRACALIEQARESQDAAELTYAENMAAVS